MLSFSLFVALSHLLCEDVAVGEAFLRRPVALALADNGARLYVANRRSGTICVIDTKRGEVVAEKRVGQGLSDIAIDKDWSQLFALDEKTGELIFLRTKPRLSVAARIQIGGAPVRLALAPDEKQVFVASLWSRRLTMVDISADQKPQIAARLDLPLAPRLLLPLADGETLLAADSFGGRLAVVEILSPARWRLRAVHSFSGHNIRGMAFSDDGKSLLLSHQILYADNATTQGGVHWGGVMSNVIRRLPLAEVLRDAPISEIDDVYYLGDPDNAAGDPSALLVTADRRRIMTFAGISALAISDRGGNAFLRVKVGRRPETIALDRSRNWVYVANRFSDSVSVVEIASRKTRAEIKLGPQPTLTPADEGEALFYDANLSSDGWYSCHSCHTDGHTNGLLNDNFSDGGYGAPKRVLSLLGVGQTGPWAWNGKAKTLEDQVRKSITLTMRGPKPSKKQIHALASYLRSLKAPRSVMAWRNETFEAAVTRGEKLFERLDCASCHDPRSQYTSASTYDVNLRDKAGNTHFNPPTLRGLTQRERFFHDNRARSLAEVFTRCSHNLPRPLDRDELKDLIAFLNTL